MDKVISMVFFAKFNTLLLLVYSGARSPNPDPSPAASGFVVTPLNRWGREIRLNRGRSPLFKHRLPVPAIINEDNIINISSLGHVLSRG